MILPCIENSFKYFLCFRCISDLKCLHDQEKDDDAFEEHSHVLKLLQWKGQTISSLSDVLIIKENKQLVL